MILRSLMFVPGHNRKLLEKALHSTADALIPDLEDSVVPDSNKDLARSTIVKFGDSGAFENHHIFPRVNDWDSGRLVDDIVALAKPWVEGFILPKVYCETEVTRLSSLLSPIEAERNFIDRHFKIIPLIETASAVLKTAEICDASQRVLGVAFGCEDFIADLCGMHDANHESLYVPRALVALGARAVGKIPIDTVHVNVHDLDDLEENLRLARTLGFEGQLVLHPKELELVHKYFSPSTKEYEDANEMLRLADEAEKEGKGVAIINGAFVGPPMVIAAKKTIARYEEIAEWEKRLKK